MMLYLFDFGLIKCGWWQGHRERGKPPGLSAGEPEAPVEKTEPRKGDREPGSPEAGLWLARTARFQGSECFCHMTDRLVASAASVLSDRHF